MRIDIMTLFPDTVGDVLSESILGRAQERGILRIETHQIRDYTANRQNQVDDYPYGGGHGAVLQADPLYRCWCHVCDEAGAPVHTIYLSPAGHVFDQSDARRLAKMDNLVFVCGHYEGIDERAYALADRVISLGDYVLTSGELASMVVIDAAKHKLDYKRSEVENDIPTLRKRWQGYTDPETGKEVGGASTLLSRRKQSVDVPERQGSGRIDKETGKVIYKESGRTYVDPKSGKTVPATTKIKLLEKVDDVRTLSSGTVQEDAYADYANRMKALANRARLEYLATPTLVRNASAAKAYAPEVTRLTSALKTAQLNAPREREAQRIANAQVKAKIQANNITDKDEISKIRRSAISDARVTTGASGKGTRITISDGEWEAIQAGAISDTTLKEILRYSDPDVIRERATPRASTQLSTARINRIKAMANSGCTNAEIADALNLSSSVVSKYLNE